MRPGQLTCLTPRAPSMESEITAYRDIDALKQQHSEVCQLLQARYREYMARTAGLEGTVQAATNKCVPPRHRQHCQPTQRRLHPQVQEDAGGAGQGEGDAGAGGAGEQDAAIRAAAVRAGGVYVLAASRGRDGQLVTFRPIPSSSQSSTTSWQAPTWRRCARSARRRWPRSTTECASWRWPRRWTTASSTALTLPRTRPGASCGAFARFANPSSPSALPDSLSACRTELLRAVRGER